MGMYDTLLALVCAVPLMLIGLAGVVVPGLPGAPLIWLGMLIYGLIAGFDNLSLWFYVCQATLAASTFAVDILATAWGVKRWGGSKAAAWGAILGSLTVFAIGPLGLLIGPLVGAIAGELILGREFSHAVRAGIGSFWGFLGGTVSKIIIAGAMIAWFFARIGFGDNM